MKVILKSDLKNRKGAGLHKTQPTAGCISTTPDT